MIRQICPKFRIVKSSSQNTLTTEHNTGGDLFQVHQKLLLNYMEHVQMLLLMHGTIKP